MDKMLQWTFQLGQNVTVDVTSRQHMSCLHEFETKFKYNLDGVPIAHSESTDKKKDIENLGQLSLQGP
jgi:hypothetical protein